MEQYPIPQFIEAESKITSFISFRQFFYFAGAGVFCFFIYFILPRAIFYLAALGVFVLTAVVSFGTINGAPILNVLMGAIGFSMGNKDFTWKKKESPYPFKPIQRAQIRKIDQGPVLQAQTSQLKKSRTSMELRTK